MYESNLAFLDLLVRTTQNAAFLKELDELMPKVCEESKNGACWDFDRWTVVAQKAIS